MSDEISTDVGLQSHRNYTDDGHEVPRYLRFCFSEK
jgi:hypothetical protein